MGAIHPILQYAGKTQGLNHLQAPRSLHCLQKEHGKLVEIES